MKAMILAAGFGTRLWPLTSSAPKPLVPVANTPLIDRIISHLAASGAKAIVVNAHHCHSRLTEHLADADTFGIPVQVRVEPEILGTGGGIKNTEDFWDDAPFVVVNGDILTDIDIVSAFDHHRRQRVPATLVLHDCPPFNKIVMDGNCTVRQIPVSYSLGRRGTFAFTGIQIIEPSLLEHIPDGCFSDIMDCYRALIAEGARIGAHVVSGHRWREIGTIPAYLRANLEAVEPEGRLFGRGCAIAPGAELDGSVVLGDGVSVQHGARVSDSVVWERATICEGVSVTGSVVTAGRTVTENMRNQAI